MVCSIGAGVGLWLYWQDRQRQQAAADSEALAAVIDDIGQTRLETVPQRLDRLARDGTEATRASAVLTRAAVALQQGDRAAAAKLYAQVAADGSLAQPWRDVAVVRSVAIQFDGLKPDEVIGRLAALAKPGNAFFGSAGEMTATALLAKGDRAGAARMFAAVAADRGVPDSIRARAVAIAGSLGIDASASFPPPSNR